MKDFILGGSKSLQMVTEAMKLKKVGKTTRSFRYDLNQIPNDYTVEVRNRFKGLDLIGCLMNYGRRSLVGYSPWGRKVSDTTERLHFTS